jgi:hypothetical protein
LQWSSNAFIRLSELKSQLIDPAELPDSPGRKPLRRGDGARPPPMAGPGVTSMNVIQQEKIMRKMLIVWFALTMVAGQASAVPIITFYKKQGESVVDCRITMGNGTVKFKSSNNACTNDDDYYFSISGAQDGVSFGIYNSGECKSDESYATYKMGNGDANRNIRMTAVDASRGRPENELIHDTLTSGGRSKSGQLHGKVSCLSVSGVTSNAPMEILPK